MSANAQSAEDIFKAEFVLNCAYFSALALTAYDHCIVLRQEIDFVWRRKLSLVTLLYTTLRAASLLFFVSYVVLLNSVSCKMLYIVYLFEGACATLLALDYAAIAALRVYAINGFDWKAPVATFALLLVNPAMGVYELCTIVTQAVDPGGCVAYQSNDDVEDKLFYAATATTIVGHALVLAATWRRTYGIKKLADASSLGTSLSSLILRDGSVYFGLTLLLDAAGLIASTKYSAVTSCFVTAMQPIVLSRFFLNLREAALVPDLPSDASGMSSMNFHHALDGISGSIVFNAERETTGGDFVYEKDSEEDGHVLAELDTGVSEVGTIVAHHS